MQVKLMFVRLAFPELFEAKQVNGEGKPAYSASFLFAPDHPAKKLLDEAIEAVAKEKWGAKYTAVMKELNAKDRTCLHDGDLKSQYAGYEGNFFVSARSEQRPTVVDADKTPLTKEDGKPYSGCYVNAIVDVYAQDNSFGKRVNASLRAVQFYRDGEAFAGGAPVSADAFDDCSEGADAEDLL